MAIPERFIEGLTLVHCSCDYGCPCEGNAEPTHGYCEGVFGLRIDEGYFADVRLDGLLIAATYHFPRASHHGGGHLQPIRNPVTGAEHRAKIVMPGGFEFTEAEFGSGTTQTSAAIVLDFADSYGQFAMIHMTPEGPVT